MLVNMAGDGEAGEKKAMVSHESIKEDAVNG